MKMNPENLVEALEAGRIVPMPVARWEAVAEFFPEVSRIPTGMGAVILLVRRPRPGKTSQGWAIVEESQPGERVMRPLPTRKVAQELIGQRLAAYERMWDG